LGKEVLRVGVDTGLGKNKRQVLIRGLVQEDEDKIKKIALKKNWSLQQVYREAIRRYKG
jgi:uncharacterized pyridoxamine 5'-phosphate oxidase family protein